jgi:hypothetical protein
MQILKAGLLYFALVFGAGSVFGPIRILWVVPRFGTRTAELMEMPIMFAVIIVAARWVVQWLDVPSTPSSHLSMGCLAVGLLLVAEFTLVIRLRGLSISEYLATRNRVSGSAYYAMLACLPSCRFSWHEDEAPTPVNHHFIVVLVDMGQPQSKLCLPKRLTCHATFSVMPHSHR